MKAKVSLDIHTQPSTWLAVASVLMTAFTALPTLASFGVHAVNILVLLVLVWQARREGADRQ